MKNNFDNFGIAFILGIAYFGVLAILILAYLR